MIKSPNMPSTVPSAIGRTCLEVEDALDLAAVGVVEETDGLVDVLLDAVVVRFPGSSAV